MMTHGKTDSLKQLDDARDFLWLALDALGPVSMVNAGWNKRDFYAHIAGWEALVYQVFRDYVADVAGKYPPFTTVDDANREFVAARQSLTLESAKLECEINRFAIKTLLQSIPDEDYQKAVQFPWGRDTVTEFIQGAIQHERDHADEIIKMTQANPL